MSKQIKVKNKKASEHKYTPVNNVGEYLEVLESHGERVLFAWNDHGEVQEMTYAEFVAMTKTLNLGMCEKFGRGAGKKIAIMGETSPYWIAAFHAIISSGNVVVPMDKELAPAEIAKFLDVAEVSAVVYSPAFSKTFEEIAKSKENLTLIPTGLDAVEKDNVYPYSSLVRDGKITDNKFSPDTDVERCCILLFTSGTTGTSKCVMLSQKNLFSTANSAGEAVDFCKDDVLVSVLPLHHTYELTCTFIAGPNFGLKIAINDSLRHVLSNFKKFQPTALILVPLFVTTMYKKIMTEAKKSGKDKILPTASKVANSLRLIGIDLSNTLFKDVREAFGGRLEKIICGGAALNPEMISTFEAFGISIYEGYGITECSPLVAVTPYTKRKPGSVGPSVSCCETRIEGTVLNDDGFLSGEIQVKGDNVMLGYMNNPEANAEAFTDDGWFRTGDIGYMDNDGYIHITGRQKSVIVLDNGKNVFPEEIEEYLEGIDLIAESVVVGREESDGTKLVAVIFPNYDKDPNMSENDLRSAIQKEIATLNKKLPSFKQLHKLEFRKTEFEKTTSKKIKRHLIK